LKIVLVEWEDAYTTHGWRDDGEMDVLHTARTVTCGILKKTKGDAISVILNQGRGVYSDGITIPKGSIKSIRQLKISERRE